MTERVRGKFSLHEEYDPEKCPATSGGGYRICNNPNSWRCVKCTGDIDVFECSQCGKQKEMACNYDEDIA